MSLRRDVYAVIDLDRLKSNVRKVYEKFNRPLMAVIKADAYGHGYEEIAECLNKINYIEMFAVATLAEAIELREKNIKKGILVLGTIPIDREDIELAIKYDITLTMVSIDYMNLLEGYIKDKPLNIHIKLDTGMHRVGLTKKCELEEMLNTIDRSKFNIEGIFTHFATADDNEVEYERQLKKFYDMIGDLKFKYIHCCNSAAMEYHSESKSNLGRVGISMYGVDPAGNESDRFKQVMSLYTKVSLIKKINKGDKVGYGLTYEAKKDEYIATLPIGYADGFIRKNQGRKVYINGKYYKIVGRVCMDQMMVRVDKNVKLGDEVEIFGDHISLASMAHELDTIPYEILCLLSKRVPRIYLETK